MKISKKLVRDQLDETLDKLKVLKYLNPPVFGWVKAIRTGLGMSGRQLANRIGVTKQSISRIEQDEVAGAITLKTLRKVAEGLDCVLVYGFVPRTSLGNMVKERSEEVARDRLHRVNQTMTLERQEIKSESIEKIIEEDIKKMVEQMPRNLWD
jgi:predicted DNA-binding mobile mystery protein A